VLGARVTLRGARMWEFLHRFINITAPNIRDFRGISSKSFDGRGNYACGIQEQSIFPEIEIDQIKRQIGFDLIFVTSAPTDAEGRALLSELGMPFRDMKKANEAEEPAAV
jgi:large subunit ribosomal protein L5